MRFLYHPQPLPSLFLRMPLPIPRMRHLQYCITHNLPVPPSCVPSLFVCLQELVKVGVRPANILFLNVVSCPEGLAALAASFPEVVVVTAGVDPGLNEHKYIVPGLGDYGDRYFGTVTH